MAENHSEYRPAVKNDDGIANGHIQISAHFMKFLCKFFRKPRENNVS
jgi:hypothetical protein